MKLFPEFERRNRGDLVVRAIQLIILWKLEEGRKSAHSWQPTRQKLKADTLLFFQLAGTSALLAAWTKSQLLLSIGHLPRALHVVPHILSSASVLP